MSLAPKTQPKGQVYKPHWFEPRMGQLKPSTVATAKSVLSDMYSSVFGAGDGDIQDYRPARPTKRGRGCMKMAGSSRRVRGRKPPSQQTGTHPQINAHRGKTDDNLSQVDGKYSERGKQHEPELDIVRKEMGSNGLAMPKELNLASRQFLHSVLIEVVPKEAGEKDVFPDPPTPTRAYKAVKKEVELRVVKRTTTPKRGTQIKKVENKEKE